MSNSHRKKLQVVHVLPSLQQGGAESIAAHIITNLNAEKFKTAAIVFNDPTGSDLESLINNKKIDIFYAGSHIKGGLKFCLRIDNIIKKIKPDIVHTHLGGLLYSFPSIFLRRVPVKVHTVHNLARKEVNGKALLIYRLAYMSGVIPVAISGAVKDSMTEVYGLRNFPVIPNGIPVDIYQNANIKKPVWRSREGLKEEDIIFVCVAGLRPQKNHALLLEAFAKAASLNPNIRLLLVGTGETEPVIKTTAKNLGLSDKVKFLGLRTDVSDILNASDIFVLSSKYEGDPLCIKEAMASSLPVIATSVGGVSEIIVDNKTGLLIPDGDAIAFANAIERMAKDPEMRKSMGSIASHIAVEKFDVKLMVKAYEELYTRAMCG